MGTARGRAGRAVASLLAIGALACAGTAGQAGAAKDTAGRLDRSFGGDGKLVTVLPQPERVRAYPNYALPFEFAPGRVTMAGSRGGKLVVASSEAIVRYLADGRRDPGFGGNGTVAVDRIDGFRFQLADVAVDSQGRVVIAGTTKATNGIGMEGLPVAGPLPSIATIRRYKPNGEPDPSFGANGVIHTFFGAPPATLGGKPYPEPAISLIGLAVDGQDRLIVTGSLVSEVGLCGASETRYETSRAFVARLIPDGRPDPSFAGGATRGIGELSWLGLPTPAAGGPIFAVGAGVASPCQTAGSGDPSIVVGIGDDGPAGPFGGDGLWSRPFTRVSDIAVAPGGKIVLLARTVELSRGRWVESAGEAVRLRANGSFDSSFGRGGRAAVPLPKRGALAAIATDAKGRVLLAGSVMHLLRRKQKNQLRFMLIRMTAAGELDERFGRGGRVITAFGRRGNVRADDVLVDAAGRISVGGKFSGPATGNGFAIARYLGGG